MRPDLSALALRLGLAWLLFALTVLALFLVGAAQSFLEPVQRNLFLGLRWLSWTGFLVSLLVLVPLGRKRAARRLAAAGLGLGFALLFAFSLVWGAWIYPDAGLPPW